MGQRVRAPQSRNEWIQASTSGRSIPWESVAGAVAVVDLLPAVMVGIPAAPLMRRLGGFLLRWQLPEVPLG
jgi:hypothetical protein